MLEDAAGIRRVVIACGYVDLRKGIDGLSMIIGDRYHQNPFEKGTEYYGTAGSSAIIRFCCFSYISILPLVTAYHNDHTSTFLPFLICC